jgi:hypothetical protein
MMRTLGILLRARREKCREMIDLGEIDLFKLSHNGRIRHITDTCLMYERTKLVAEGSKIECDHPTFLACSECVEETMANFTIGASDEDCLHASEEGVNERTVLSAQS